MIIPCFANLREVLFDEFVQPFAAHIRADKRNPRGRRVASSTFLRLVLIMFSSRRLYSSLIGLTTTLREPSSEVWN